MPSHASFTNYSAVNAWESPDGISNYSLRSAPTIIGGKNSIDAIPTNDASFIARGQGWLSYFAKEQPDTRVQDWNLTLEKEVLPDTVARVAAVGNHTSNLEQYYRYNENPPAYVWYARTGLPRPSGEFGNVAMRPHDQQVLGTIEEFQKTKPNVRIDAGYAGQECRDVVERRAALRRVGAAAFFATRVRDACGAGASTVSASQRTVSM